MLTSVCQAHDAGRALHEPCAEVRKVDAGRSAWMEGCRGAGQEPAGSCLLRHRPSHSLLLAPHPSHQRIQERCSPILAVLFLLSRRNVCVFVSSWQIRLPYLACMLKAHNFLDCSKRNSACRLLFNDALCSIYSNPCHALLSVQSDSHMHDCRASKFGAGAK